MRTHPTGVVANGTSHYSAGHEIVHHHCARCSGGHRFIFLGTRERSRCDRRRYLYVLLPAENVLRRSIETGQHPLWHPHIGYGVPLVGESQTGVFYPINLLSYRLLDVESAYCANIVFHYWLLFVAAAVWLRRMGVGIGAACVGAASLTFGWFVPRVCLEWAYVTGAWMMVALAGMEDAHRGRPRRGWTVAVCAMGVQLLCGHFQMAFITMMAVGLLSLVRGWTTAKTRRARLGRPRGDGGGRRVCNGGVVGGGAVVADVAVETT